MKKKLFYFSLCFEVCFGLLTAKQVSAMSIVEHGKNTFVDAFDSTGFIILGATTVATALASTQDQAIHDTWRRDPSSSQQRMGSDASGFGNFWGTGIPEVTIALGQLIFDTNRGIADTEGLLASTVVTYGLKFSTQRARPDSDTKTAFPSGHTQIAFASATSLTKSYGWKVGIPFFALGVFTGLSRLADNAHWLSDVVAGAGVGILFGRAPFSHHFEISPMVMQPQDRGYGLLVSLRI
jgi:hypothetical protein